MHHGTIKVAGNAGKTALTINDKFRCSNQPYLNVCFNILTKVAFEMAKPNFKYCLTIEFTSCRYKL